MSNLPIMFDLTLEKLSQVCANQKKVDIILVRQPKDENG